MLAKEDLEGQLDQWRGVTFRGALRLFGCSGAVERGVFDRYAWFVTHDPGTDGRDKRFALLAFNNGWLAAILSLVVCLVLSYIETAVWSSPVTVDLKRGNQVYEVKVAPLAFTIGICTYFITLFFGHLMYGCKNTGWMLSVDHNDPVSMTKAISSMEDAMQVSDKLMVLWSEDFFNRLECTFELAAWLKNQKEKQTAIIPVTLGRLLIVLCAYEAFGFLAFLWLNVWSGQAAEISLLATCAFVMIPMQLARAIGNATYRWELEIQNFKVRQTECYCCSSRSRAGERCHRKLIYETMLKWFPKRNKRRSNLDDFDNYVRDDMGPTVLSEVLTAQDTTALIPSAALLLPIPLMYAIAVYINVPMVFSPTMTMQMLLTVLLSLCWMAIMCRLFWTIATVFPALDSCLIDPVATGARSAPLMATIIILPAIFQAMVQQNELFLQQFLMVGGFLVTSILLLFDRAMSGDC